VVTSPQESECLSNNEQERSHIVQSKLGQVTRRSHQQRTYSIWTACLVSFGKEVDGVEIYLFYDDLL
jgi:hypothetical protein